MSRLERNERIKVNQKEHLVNDLLKSLIYLPSQSVLNWFEQIGLSVPRELRIAVLKDTLRERVLKTRIERKTLADELNYRLSWFNEFTELQLENLLVFYNDVNLDKAYYELLWLELISYFVSKSVPHHNFQELIDESIKHVKSSGLKLEDTKTFNQTLWPLFFDRKDRIDGLSLEKIRPVLYKSSTLTEIREIGTKYGVNVPKRLKKNELADIIILELKDRNQHTEDEEAKVRAMSILVLQRYAKDNNIKASTELKKEEIIEYILKNANETRETYFVPQTSDVYNVEFNDKEELPDPVPVNQEVVEEAVVDEPIEEVAQKIEEKVVYAQNVNVDELVSELKLLRKAIEEKETNVVVSQQSTSSSNQASRAPFDVASVETSHVESVLHAGNKKTWKKTNKEISEIQAASEEDDIIIDPVNPNDSEKLEIVVDRRNRESITEFKFFKALLKGLLWLLIILLILGVIAGVIAGLFLTPTTSNDTLNSIIEFLNKLFNR